MRFSHADSLWFEFPQLVPAVLQVQGVSVQLDVAALAAPLHQRARERLALHSEGEWAEIQAWRRAFSRMGLKPTQYRGAAESLLRRFRKDGALPRLHPLVDLCNAFSLAHAVPIAVFDLERIDRWLEVRRAAGSERYQDFSGAVEQPDPGEVVFVDGSGHAHARRWCHRQSARSAVGDATADVLIVAEAMHDGARAGIERLAADLGAALADVGAAVRRSDLLSRERSVFVLDAPSPN